MRLNLSPLPKRPRIRDYDYSAANFYFVTIITDNKQCTLANIIDFESVPKSLGHVVLDSLDATLKRYPRVRLDCSSVLPNHLHLLFQFEGDNPVSLPRIVNEIKSRSTVFYNKQRNQPGAPVWQYGYDERIIRSERHLFAVRNYIINNPAKWAVDKLNPSYRP